MVIKNITFFGIDEPEGEYHVAYDTLSRRSLQDIELGSHGGRNVDWETRVTGFFSKVSGWNKGKRGELKDRYRSSIASVPNGGKVSEELGKIEADIGSQGVEENAPA